MDDTDAELKKLRAKIRKLQEPDVVARQQAEAEKQKHAAEAEAWRPPKKLRRIAGWRPPELPGSP